MLLIKQSFRRFGTPLYRRPLLGLVVGCAYIKESDFTGDTTRKPSYGCEGLSNRRREGLTPFARVCFRFQTALFSFTDDAIRAFTGLLQCLHCAISFVECPQYKGETAFRCIEGSALS